MSRSVWQVEAAFILPVTVEHTVMPLEKKLGKQPTPLQTPHEESLGYGLVPKQDQVLPYR